VAIIKEVEEDHRKGELKAEFSNFSNLSFGKSNINEVNFVELFPLVYCFLQGNYVQSWIFPAFAVFSLWAQNVNHQPAVTYDMAMGKRDFVIKRNKINTSAAMHTFFVVQLVFF